jgi:hypothetical protein
MIRKYLLAVILGVLAISLRADPYIYGEFVYNLNIDNRITPFPEMGTDEFEKTVTDDYEKKVITMLLEEARWVFSGMIYGFSVEYTPSDISRSVDRFLEILPLAQIPFGDPGLEVYDTYLEDNLFRLFIRYQPDVSQQRRIDFWQSGVFESASAYGYSPLFSDDGRINSIKDAIRISLENVLKPEEFNKPSLIEADVLLRTSPSITVDAGRNRAYVKLRVDIKNVQHYLTNN